VGTINVPAALLELAAAQDGVVSRTQATRLGFGRYPQQRMVQVSAWQRLAPGIFLTHNATPPWGALAWAGVLLAGDGARLGGLAAAYGHRLTDEPPQQIDLLHPHGSRLKSWGLLCFHQERDGVRPRTTVGSPPRTTIDDTVLDLIGTDLGRSSGKDAVHWLTAAVQRRLTTPERLLQAVHQRRQLAGRNEVINLLTDVADGVQSPLEHHYRRHVEAAHGLPRSRRQASARSGGQRLWRDVYYERFRLLVELDGTIGHTGEGRFRDYRRDNAALMDGDVTLRYGWHDVRRETCQVARQVARMLRRGGWQDHPHRCPNCSPGLMDDL
jgi:very-short-patch-repair endonuclease